MRINGVQCDKCKNIADCPIDPMRYSALECKVPMDWFTVYQGNHDTQGPIMHFCSSACLVRYMDDTYYRQTRE